MEEYQHKFIDDALDLLADIENALLQLEDHPDEVSLIEEIFRCMHTIKGAANMFGFSNIGEITHQLENVYDAIRNDQCQVNETILSLTLNAVDHLRVILDDHTLSKSDNLQTHQELEDAIKNILTDIDRNAGNNVSSGTTKNKSFGKNFVTYHIILRPIPGKSNWEQNDPTYIFVELEQLGPCKIIKHHQKITDDEQTSVDLYWDIFLGTERGKEAIEGIFLFADDEFNTEILELAATNLLKEKKFLKVIEQKEKSGEEIDLSWLKEYVDELLPTLKKSQADQIKHEGNQQSTSKKFAKKESFKVSREKVDQMMEWVSELIIIQGALQMLSNKHSIAEFSAVAEKVELIASGLRQSVFSISLVELSTLKTRFDRLIRDLSKSLGKEVDLLMEGAETELDKSIIEQITDPLLHMLRNCLDHGLESAEEREQAGKPKRGFILIKSYNMGNHIFIEIRDDGRGIDPEKIRQKAIEKGLIASNEILSNQQLLQLIFSPGFSTAANVTDVSGRGVGMDVVKQRVKDLHGEVEIISEVGKGTTITIKLPLTLSIIEGLLVKVNDLYLIIPLEAVNRCDKVPTTQTQNEQQFNTNLIIDDEPISLINLRKKFGFEDTTSDEVTLVTVREDGSQKGLVVDEVIGQQQVVLKPLGRLYQDLGWFSGGSVMGDGNLALVLDINYLVQHNKQKNII